MANIRSLALQRTISMKKTLIALSSCAVFLAGCNGAGSGDPAGMGEEPIAGVTVEIDAFRYQPDPVEVKVGETITWTNNDQIDHTVTSGKQRDQGVPGVDEDQGAMPDGRFNGALPEKGATFSFTFDEPGTFPYYCAIHAGMTGTVEVTN